MRALHEATRDALPPDAKALDPFVRIPELGRVVLLDEVNQLVDYDVLDDPGWQQDRRPMIPFLLGTYVR